MTRENNDILKYAAIGLMGLYVFKKYQGAGFGDHYFTAKQKADGIVDRLTNSLPIEEQHRKLANTALKGAADQMINDHLGIRVIE